MLLPGVAGELLRLELVPGVAQFSQGLIDPGKLAASPEQGIEPFLEQPLGLSQAGQTSACREQQLSEVPLPRANLFTGTDQLGMADPEERLEGLPIHAPQEPIEPFGRYNGRIVGVSKRVLDPLAAQRLEHIAVTVTQGAADAQLAVGMDEIIARGVRKTEQQVRHRPQRRGLASLVLTVNQVQPVIAGREVEFEFGERPDGFQVQTEQFHGAFA